MSKRKKNIKASQKRKPTNKANPITGQDTATRSEDQAVAEKVDESLGSYLEDILRKVAEIEEEALKSHDEDKP